MIRSSGMLLVLLVLAVLWACGSDSTEDTIRDALEDQQDQLDFTLIVPAYLPSGTSRQPSGVSVDGSYVEYVLEPVTDPDELDPSRRPALAVRQDDRSDGECHPGFIRGKDPVQVAGHEAEVTKTNSGTRVVRVLYSAKLRDVCLSVTFGWYADEQSLEIELTSEMEQEAERIFESMLKEGRD